MSSTKILVGTCCKCCVTIKWSGVSMQMRSKIFLHSTSGEYDHRRETIFVESFSLWDPVTQSANFWCDGKLLQDCATKTSVHCLSRKQCKVWYFSLTVLVTCLNKTSNTQPVTLTKLFTVNSHVLFAIALVQMPSIHRRTHLAWLSLSSILQLLLWNYSSRKDSHASPTRCKRICTLGAIQGSRGIIIEHIVLTYTWESLQEVKK